MKEGESYLDCQGDDNGVLVSSLGLRLWGRGCEIIILNLEYKIHFGQQRYTPSSCEDGKKLGGFSCKLYNLFGQLS